MKKATTLRLSIMMLLVTTFALDICHAATSGDPTRRRIVTRGAICKEYTDEAGPRYDCQYDARQCEWELMSDNGPRPGKLLLSTMLCVKKQHASLQAKCNQETTCESQFNEFIGPFFVIGNNTPLQPRPFTIQDNGSN